MYQWLPLKDVLRSTHAMDKGEISEVARGKKESKQTREGFVEAYIATNGSIPKMKKRLTGRNDRETWDKRRDQFIARHLEQMRKGDTYSSGWNKRGEPTPRHLALIAWAYSPSPKRLSAWLRTQPKEWKPYVSNPSEQLTFDFTEYDPYIPSLSKAMVMEIMFAVNDKENKQPTVVIGTSSAPKNKGIAEAINKGYMDVVKVIDHTLSGMKMWVVKPSRKGLALAKKRREIHASKFEQLDLFKNPKKSVNVAIHLLSKEGIHEKIGDIKLSDTACGLKIDTDLHNLPSGFHGTHIHEFGDLSPSIKGDKKIAGGSAGSHYDPENAGFHGSPQGKGHRGDLPKIHADEYGTSQETLYAPRLKLKEILGRSIVVHRYGDNYSDHPLPNGGGKERMAGGIISGSCPHCKNPKSDKGGKYVPERYLKGYKGKLREKRKKEIVDRNKEIAKAQKKYGKEDNFPQYVKRILYRPFVTDKVKHTGESPFTRAARERGFNADIPKEKIISTAKEIGIVTAKDINETKIDKRGNKDKQGEIPRYVYPVLKKTINASVYYDGVIPFSSTVESYRRGAAAWKTGHYKAQTPESWGLARVNSFLVGGKTFFTSDSDLAKKLPKNVQKSIIKQRVWKG